MKTQWTVGEGEGGANWEWHWNIYITICKIDSQWEFVLWCMELKPNALWQPRGMGWSGKEVQEGGDLCIPMADSYWYMAEANTVL